MTREEFEALPKIQVRGTEYRVFRGSDFISVLEPDEEREVLCLRLTHTPLEQMREVYLLVLRAFDRGKAAGREELQDDLRKLLNVASRECS